MDSYKDFFDRNSVELKVVRIFLISIIILFVYQTLQFVNIRRIDRKHSELLVIRNQTLGEVQNLLIQSSTIQRKLLNMALTSDENEIRELRNIIGQAAIINDKSLAEIEKSLGKINSFSEISISDLRNASEDYRIVYTSYMNKLLAGQVQEAMEFKNSDLRPAYEAYQSSQQQVLIKITDDLVAQSNKLSSYTSVSSWILFFIGLAPFIYAIIKLIYLSVYFKLNYSKNESGQGKH
jgi:hypothetical protein